MSKWTGLGNQLQQRGDAAAAGPPEAAADSAEPMQKLRMLVARFRQRQKEKAADPAAPAAQGEKPAAEGADKPPAEAAAANPEAAPADAPPIIQKVMASGDFESKPYDGQHPVAEPGNDWRDGGGAGGMLERATSYGNFAGHGNRILAENPEARAEKEKDPKYDETSDPKYAGDPRYQPIDPMDAAAKQHDSDYTAENQGNSMWSWQGIRDVEKADKKLVGSVDEEMDQNGGKYSKGAQAYSEGMRGFFGARGMGLDAVDFADKKGGEAEAGMAAFAGQAKGWKSPGEAAQGMEKGAGQAAEFVKDTGSAAVEGVEGAAEKIGKLGAPGIAGAAGGFGEMAGAGAVNEVEEGIKWLEDRLK